MIKSLLSILTLLCVLATNGQSIKAYIVNNKGEKLSSVKVEVSYQKNKDSYIANSKIRPIYVDVNAKYRFSKAGFYPKTFQITSHDYNYNIDEYSKPINIQLEKLRVVLNELDIPVGKRFDVNRFSEKLNPKVIVFSKL